MTGPLMISSVRHTDLPKYKDYADSCKGREGKRNYDQQPGRLVHAF